ncbi:TRAP transporter large permease [Bordetella petrii]|jgi:tripartite ATP-independent transporter DctM subunit|uniref:TRAP transporter large permease n=1 Tax=Bordetella petrii TaxID=94624 RepID=UPI00047CEC36|nr:TRAP transporter large permease [Bordetella petrii]
MTTYVLLLVFAALLVMGMPVAFAMGAAAAAAAYVSDIPFAALVIKLVDGTNQVPMLAIPLFILAGAIMAEGGMARRLVDLAKALLGSLKGGLSLVNVCASTLFGCISGSTVADTASIGSVMIPQMEKNGYPRTFATNITMTGSLQATILPPSHNFVIYSLAAGGMVSVPALFLAGILPGLLLGLCLAALCLYYAYRHDFPRGEATGLRLIRARFIDAGWGLITVVIITGGILSGVFTATESAGVACVYALAVTMFVYRDYRWKDLPKLLSGVVRTCGIIMIMMATASAFGYMMALERVPQQIAELFLAYSSNVTVFLILANIALLVLGIFMELTPMLLICVPVFMPIIMELGIDPVHFGVIMVLNLAIGLVTPPVGATLFAGIAVGRVTMEQITRTIWPFYVAMLICLLLVTYVPALSLWLPALAGAL